MLTFSVKNFVINARRPVLNVQIKIKNGISLSLSTVIKKTSKHESDTCILAL